jgi:UDP-glucose 4-epimerase
LFFDRCKVLVVGGAGFVGSNLVRYLLNEGNPKEIYIVDNLLSSEMSNVPLDERVKFIFGSITDEKILKKLPSDVDYAFHLACFHGNQSSIADPLQDHENNTLTSLKLFDRLKDFKNLKKLVYASAACAVAEKTYDAPTATTEEQPITLYHDSPYSISKIIGEFYGNYYFKHFGLPFVKARFSNVYGPGEILGAGQWRGTPHTVWRNVTPTFIWKALKQDALPLENAGDASRDFIFVEDMARGLAACALRGQVGEVYNLATGKETTIRELAEYINKYTENPTAPLIKPKRDWDGSGKRFASTEKAYTDLGFKAAVNIEDGLQKTVAWTKENYTMIESSMKKHQKNLNQCALQ